MRAKRHLSDLAIFGGPPAFAEALHVGRPNIGDRRRLLQRIGDILDRKWLSNDGPYVQEFERRIAELAGVKHCLAICNGTVALEIAIKALGLTGEVIVPAMTFIATAHALQWLGLRPVFCDIDPMTYTLDPARVEEAITAQTSGIIGVHLWGRVCDVAGLEEVARRYGLRLLFDAAHALGCSRGGRMVGGFGHGEIFSFHATKFANSFEGGAIATDDDALAQQVRLMRNFGFAGYDAVATVGTNGKMHEVSAAMGLTSLESLEEFVSVNRRNYERYRQVLSRIPGLDVLSFDEREQQNYQYVVVEVDAACTGVSRDQLVQVLWAENVLARRYFYPGCHRMEPYRTINPAAGRQLPVTEALADRVMTLPTGTAISAAEIDAIAHLLAFVIARGPEIAERLTGSVQPLWVTT